MKAMPWFRMYTDFLDDPKMISLAFEDQRHFIGVLALKSSGVLETDCDAKLLNRIVAQRLWVDQSAIIEVKNRLVNAGLIFDNWQPVAWDKRQMQSDHDDSGAERQRKFRENKRNALRNGQVTPPEEIRGDKKRKEDSSELLSHSEQPLTDFSIPLVDSSVYQVPVKDFDSWTLAYPAVDVGQELLQMAAWVSANPAKRKTRRGVAAFAVRWLSKAQDLPRRNTNFGASVSGTSSALAGGF